MSRVIQDHEETLFTLLFSYLLMDPLVNFTAFENKRRKRKKMVVKTPLMMTFKG